MDRSSLPAFGLAWNPFEPEVPLEALHVNAAVDAFRRYIATNLVRVGGFALTVCEPGTVKSATPLLRAARCAEDPGLAAGSKVLTLLRPLGTPPTAHRRPPRPRAPPRRREDMPDRPHPLGRRLLSRRRTGRQPLPRASA